MLGHQACVQVNKCSWIVQTLLALQVQPRLVSRVHKTGLVFADRPSHGHRTCCLLSLDCLVGAVRISIRRLEDLSHLRPQVFGVPTSSGLDGGKMRYRQIGLP